MAKRVLICDDSLFSRTALSSIFKKEGFEVCGEAENGIDAVDKYRSLKPDLVTMDILMSKNQDGDGIAAVKAIMKIDSGAKIVMISAMNQNAFVVEALEAGAKEFITKPFDHVKVITISKKICEL
jgi:two-component system chemotaxis response regulator CheY